LLDSIAIDRASAEELSGSLPLGSAGISVASAEDKQYKLKYNEAKKRRFKDKALKIAKMDW
jgi:hypothetical protein